LFPTYRALHPEHVSSPPSRGALSLAIHGTPAPINQYSSISRPRSLGTHNLQVVSSPPKPVENHLHSPAELLRTLLTGVYSYNTEHHLLPLAMEIYRQSMHRSFLDWSQNAEPHRPMVAEVRLQDRKSVV
jgi:hypothetical protein